MRRSFIGLIVSSLAFVVLVYAIPVSTAQDKPALTIEQRQAIQILAQRIELAQLRAQAAQMDFEKARGELSSLLQTLNRDGYDLDLQSMQYVKKPEPPKKDSGT
jgi:hypothetical protein